MRQLVPCDVVSYGEFDPDRRGYRRAPRWFGEPRAALTTAIAEAFQALRHQYPHAISDDVQVLRWSDRLSRRAMRRLEIYWEVGHPLGAEFELTLWLAHGDTVYGGFALDRFRSDFTDRDLQVLETLLPHLVQLARNASRRWSDAAAVLTRREREILDWLAQGKTNAEIAKRLYISPGTVHKHLDNIYAKLDVPNRAAAVSRAYGIGAIDTSPAAVAGLPTDHQLQNEIHRSNGVAPGMVVTPVENATGA